MQAILTVYLGPTNHRGSRIKARCEARSTTVPWDYSLGVEANHKAAAEALANSLEWGTNFVGGSLPGKLGYAFVYLVAGGT